MGRENRAFARDPGHGHEQQEGACQTRKVYEQQARPGDVQDWSVLHV